MSRHHDLIADRYRVLEEAGRGGMGSVYRCVDGRLDREVAVKQVGRTPGESVTDQARALREARSSAALNHPHVVAVYDALAEGDHIWLVMEYVPGRTLSQILRDEGPLPPARAAWIGAQVADGLAAAHERGTVHRDVKPGNVLVAEDDHAKISDFGIARTLGDTTLTGSGVLSGTPAYIAPEVARGGDPSPAADVWALGATLYSAVEGRAPYEDDRNPLALLATIANQPPRPPERAGPLTDALRRMLDRDPESRWAMADAAHALHRLAEQHTRSDDTREETPVLAAAPAASPTPSRPHPEPAPAPAPTPTPAPPVAPPRDRPRNRWPLVVAGVVVLLAATIGALLLLDRSQEEDRRAGEASTGTGSSRTSSSDSDAPSPEDTPGSSPGGAGSPGGGADETGTGAAGGSDEPAAFVEDYYALLPGDTEAGYELLSPSYRDRTSFGEYDGFWSTVDSVSVVEIASVGRDAVDVTLVYDGSEREVRRIYLERDGDEWLITDDEVVA